MTLSQKVVAVDGGEKTNSVAATAAAAAAATAWPRRHRAPLLKKGSGLTRLKRKKQVFSGFGRFQNCEVFRSFLNAFNPFR